MKFVTQYWKKPIPFRLYDWEATTSNYEAGDPIGFGATEQAAIADLCEQLWERYGDQDDIDEQKAEAASYTATGHAAEVD